MHTLPGGRLGRYELIREVARSNDVVFEGWDPHTHRRVAVKALNLTDGITPTQREDRIRRFEREARATARLQHPNVVTLYDFGTEGEQPYLIFEFVQGPTLAEVLERSGSLGSDRALVLTQQILSALGYAHSQGIVHRDIKPSNIFVCQGDQLKIADLGIARIESEQAVTSDGQIFGTPAYMAPEQVRGLLVDQRADIWATGVVLFLMITGTQPFTGGSVLEIGANILTEEPNLDLITDPGLRRVVGKALEKAPDARFSHTDEFKSALESSPLPARLAPTPSVTLATIAAVPATKISASKKRTLPYWIWAGSLSLGVCAALLGISFSQGAKTHQIAPPPAEAHVAAKSVEEVYDEAWEHNSLHELASSRNFQALWQPAQLDQLDTWARTTISHDYLALDQASREVLLGRILNHFREVGPNTYATTNGTYEKPSSLPMTTDDVRRLNQVDRVTSAGPIIPPPATTQLRSSRPGTVVIPAPESPVPTQTIHLPAPTHDTGPTFDVGASETRVLDVQGPPDEVHYLNHEHQLHYGNSVVTIRRGRVAEIVNVGNLRVAGNTQAQVNNDSAVLAKLHFQVSSVLVLSDGTREYRGPSGVVRIR